MHRTTATIGTGVTFRGVFRVLAPESESSDPGFHGAHGKVILAGDDLVIEIRVVFMGGEHDIQEPRGIIDYPDMALMVGRVLGGVFNDFTVFGHRERATNRDDGPVYIAAYSRGDDPRSRIV